MHYFIIAFLEYHSEDIISADYSQIPSIISQLTIKSTEMIDIIFENAKRIRSITPYSFRLFFNKLDVFKPFSKRHKELFEHYQPENLMCLPILPSEIFFIAYNKIVSCPDKNCRYFNNLYNNDIDNSNMIFSEKNNRSLNENKNADTNYNGNIAETNNSENDFFNEEKRNQKEKKFLTENNIDNNKIMYINNGKIEYYCFFKFEINCIQKYILKIR